MDDGVTYKTLSDLIDSVDQGRRDRAGKLKVVVDAYDPVRGMILGRVVSGADEDAAYNVSIKLHARRVRCSCEDFRLNRNICKHAVAMAEKARAMAAD